MKAEEILNRIAERGWFVYEPELWNNENDVALKELLDLELIQRSSDDDHSTMNPDYTYIEKIFKKKGGG